MWKYRFFYANLPEILSRDEKLHNDYMAVQERLQANLIAIMRAFVDLNLVESFRRRDEVNGDVFAPYCVELVGLPICHVTENADYGTSSSPRYASDDRSRETYRNNSRF